MRIFRAGILALAVTAVAVFAAPTPSVAADYYGVCDAGWVSCQNGVEVTSTAGADKCVTAGGDYHYTKVCVDYDGDYVYVYDSMFDDHSAMAHIESDYGNILNRYCRNPHGFDSWARCNFDWREDGEKWIYGGYRRTSTYYFGDYQLLWKFTNN